MNDDVKGTIACCCCAQLIGDGEQYILACGHLACCDCAYTRLAEKEELERNVYYAAYLQGAQDQTRESFGLPTHSREERFKEYCERVKTSRPCVDK